MKTRAATGRRRHLIAHMTVAKVAGWAVYLVSVVVLEGLFLILVRALTGQQLNETPQLFLVGSTLVIAVLLIPLRRRLQAYIDRRLRERQALHDAREEVQQRQRR